MCIVVTVSELAITILSFCIPCIFLYCISYSFLPYHIVCFLLLLRKIEIRTRYQNAKTLFDEKWSS